MSNNFELARLRGARARANLRYFALAADFEPDRIGWKLWKVLSEFGDRAADATVNRIFPKENDLVVDTAHMTTLAQGRPIEDVTSFLQQATVHHCNYFRQPDAVASLRKWLLRGSLSPRHGLDN